MRFLHYLFLVSRSWKLAPSKGWTQQEPRASQQPPPLSPVPVLPVTPAGSQGRHRAAGQAL